jgi:hypothetical protein
MTLVNIDQKIINSFHHHQLLQFFNNKKMPKLRRRTFQPNGTEQNDVQEENDVR